METEFIYWSHRLPQKITVEEISGGEDKSPAVWKAMALQLYAEHAPDGGYRVIEHFPGGAPASENREERISLTHTDHFMAIASLPACGHAVGEEFESGNALGIDAERWDREQAMRVRERFLNDEELKLIPAGELAPHVLAWTIKEAVYKAMLIPGLDFRRDIKIRRLPDIKGRRAGEAEAVAAGGAPVLLQLYSWDSEGVCVTVAKG